MCTANSQSVGVRSVGHLGCRHTSASYRHAGVWGTLADAALIYCIPGSTHLLVRRLVLCSRFKGGRTGVSLRVGQGRKTHAATAVVNALQGPICWLICWFCWLVCTEDQGGGKNRYS